MRVKVLDSQKVKILIEDQDILEYNLPFEKINYDDQYSKAFICDLIRKTYEQTGINFRDARVMIEVIPGVARSYYVVLTKVQSDGNEQIEFDKTERSEPDVYVFKLDRGGDVFRFFSIVKAACPDTSELYYYDNRFYAVLSFMPHVSNDKAFLELMNLLAEFADRCQYRYVNSGLLAEWGELISAPNAIEQLFECRSNSGKVM